MKKLIVVLLVVMSMFSVKASAQTRVLVGVDAGSGFGSLFAGPSLGIETGTNRAELDAYGTYLPAYQHPSAGGNGFAYKYSVGPTIWFTKSVGFNGSVNNSAYKTATVSKDQQFFTAGVSLRKSIQGMPIRFKWDYLQEFNDGIAADGTESSHLKGGSYEMDMLTGCHGAVCFRLDITGRIARVLQQGNPVCDGTFGVTGGPNGGPCYRTASSSGAFDLKLSVVWPRPRGHESDPF